MLRHLGPRSHAQWTVPAGVRDDVRWWHSFVSRWNGVSLLYELNWLNAEGEAVSLETDACKDGYGAVYGVQWFAGRWSPEQIAAAQRSKIISMPFMELHALVQAAYAWGPQWAGKKVIFLTDCEVAVHVIEAKDGKVEALMHLLRLLITAACRYGFDFRARHIPGITNVAADALSRSGDCQAFRAACPYCLPLPSYAPPIPLPPPRPRA
jgi:hypothetical protein